ncbi:MAG: hypothetical protein AB4063_09390 [Crocosphaera sp.]
MKKPFQWSWNNYVYSLERLADLIDKDRERALFHLKYKNFEEWFDSIGDIILYRKVKQCRKDYESKTNDSEKDAEKENFCNNFPNTLKRRSNNKSFIDLLDINRAIDFTLKEYEALRAEVLQNTSEISQLILLGLAAIFTIASIGLAPLSDFLTVEDTIIEMPLNLKDIKIEAGDLSITDNKFKIYNEPKQVGSSQTELEPIRFREFLNSISIDGKQITDEQIDEILNSFRNKYKIDDQLDLNKAEMIIRDTPDNTKYSLKIKRTTNGQTIEERGIVPSIVIFN